MSEPAAVVTPQNLGAEESVLGAMMLSDKALGVAIESRLLVSDFYRETHGRIFRAMNEMAGKAIGVDIVTVTDYLAQRRDDDRSATWLELVGGEAEIRDIASCASAGGNVLHHCEIVHEQAQLRGLLDLGHNIQQLVRDRGADVSGIIDQAEQMLFQVAGSSAAHEVMSIDDVVAVWFRSMQIMSESEGMTGVPTGFDDLDELTQGWQPGNLIVLAARPSMGKSALALCMTSTAALHHGIPVLVFSLEMGNGELAGRLVGDESRVPSNVLRRPHRMTSDDWDRLTKASGRISRTPISIDASSSITMAEIRSKARRWRLKNPHPLGLVVVDYLQLVDMQLQRGETLTQAVGRVTRGLKILAGDLAVPIIALSQLSRGVEQRGDPIPRLSDLRDSGAIEQDADLVVFIHRPDQADPADRPGEADVVLAKQRNGPTGRTTLRFVKQYARFEQTRRTLTSTSTGE